MNNEPDYKDNLFFDNAKDAECCVKLEHMKLEILLNGIFYALEKLNKALSKEKDKQVYLHIEEAQDSLRAVLKQLS